MDEIINLEEILDKATDEAGLYLFLSPKKQAIMRAMRRACEACLDLGAEKAKVKSTCPDDYMSGYETIVDKQTILNVKKLIIDGNPD